MVTASGSLVFFFFNLQLTVTNRMSVSVPMERGSSQNTCVRTVVIRAFNDSLAGKQTSEHKERKGQSNMGDG